MATDYFLKIAGIQGESSDAKHKGEIDILSYSWGEANSGSAAHPGAARVSMQDFHFTTKFNKASPKLQLAVATGQRITNAILTVRKTTGEVPVDFLKYTLSTVLISSYQTAGAGQPDPTPTDQFSINFHKIQVDLLTEGIKGTTSTSAVNTTLDSNP